jgi:flagellar basal body-associated protein FliL
MVEPVPEINGADLVNLLATDETADHSKLISIFIIQLIVKFIVALMINTVLNHSHVTYCRNLEWKILQIFNDVRQRLIEHGFKGNPIQ